MHRIGRDYGIENVQRLYYWIDVMHIMGDYGLADVHRIGDYGIGDVHRIGY